MGDFKAPDEVPAPVHCHVRSCPRKRRKNKAKRREIGVRKPTRTPPAVVEISSRRNFHGLEYRVYLAEFDPDLRRNERTRHAGD